MICKISLSLSDISGESQRQTGNNTATQNIIFKSKLPVIAAFIWNPPVVLKRLFAPATWHYQHVLFAASWNVSCLTFPGCSYTQSAFPKLIKFSKDLQSCVNLAIKPSCKGNTKIYEPSPDFMHLWFLAAKVSPHCQAVRKWITLLNNIDHATYN